MRPVPEIFKMAGYFPGSPRIQESSVDIPEGPVHKEAESMSLS